jgi:nitroimidazol reductase NimA-like FMN-containing flavoprotein (pyridoxamine 5'-phosphate oxidase superfamily)
MLAELTHSEIEVLLADNSIGRIGCRDGDLIYVVPVSYHYEDGFIYCWSLEGMKLRIMRQNPDVCFEVEELRGPQHWKTAICWGIFEEITNEEELAVLRPRYNEWVLRSHATLSALPPAERAEGTRPDPKAGPPVFYRIRLSRFTGRMERGF